MEKLLKFIIENATTGKIERQTAVEALQLIRGSKGLRTDDEIAIIGMAGRVPGANTLDDFWNNLSAGVDSVGPFPKTRSADIERYLRFAGVPDEELQFSQGAFLDKIDEFDYKFFRLSPKEASLMDPNQRVFLQTAWHAIEDAGYGGDRLVGSKTGVYTGFATTFKDSYQKMILDVEPESLPFSVAANLPAMIPTRISYLLDLKGPTLLLDTACSSGLVAMHLACQAIRNGDCEMALAGAVKLHTVPMESPYMKTGVESSDARTRAFNDQTDGAGFGEGAIVVLLKPLTAALRDGDQVYAVIKGSAINQDGTSMSITAPNPIAQTEVILKAWEAAGIHPETLSYIETHGTGTELGDPIEIDGLSNAFARHTDKKQFCAIGSVKPNIGHLYECAGMANLLAGTLMIKNRQLLPTIHVNRPNRHIDFVNSPVFLNTKLRTWEAKPDTPRRLGINSFGFSGTNCHLVLEEPPSREETTSQVEGLPYLLTLSAKSKTALTDLVLEYRRFLANVHPQRLRDVCYTAQIGRGHYEYRLAIVFGSREEAVAKLDQLVAQSLEATIEGVFYGDIQSKNSGEEAQGSRLSAKDLVKLLVSEPSGSPSQVGELCQMYVTGADVPWLELYAGQKLQKISLPLYPFERNRCWLNIPEASVAKADHQDLGNHFGIQWVEQARPASGSFDRSDCVLVLDRDSANPLGQQLADALKKQGVRVIQALLGDRYEREADDRYRVTGTEEDAIRLLNDLKGCPLAQIVQVAVSEADASSDLQALEATLQQGVYRLFHLTRALQRLPQEQMPEIVLVGQQVYAVDGAEQALCPEQAPLFGLGKVVAKEHPELRCRALDIDRETPIEALLEELRADEALYQVAYRNGKRYVEQFGPLDLAAVPMQPLELREDGVYVVTGGFGGIGLALTRFLAQKKHLQLALIGRTGLPDRDEWECLLQSDDLSPKLRSQMQAVLELEQSGSHVTCYRADVADESRMAEVFADLRARHGRIRGVIHGAGLPSNELIQQRKQQDFQVILAPKVQGAWVLDKLTAEDDLDFMILFSSLATLLEAPGQGDYIAANAYLDAMAAARQKRGARTLTVNWSTWKETGMAFDAGFNIDTIFKAIPTEQALQAFDQALNKRMTNVLIGELNVQSEMFLLLGKFRFTLHEQLAKRLAGRTTKQVGRAAVEKGAISGGQEVRLSGRPDGCYTATELQVARIWGAALGFEEMGVKDNYYELGGDSVIGIRIINQVMEQLHRDVSTSDLLLNLTIESFAGYLDSLQEQTTGVSTGRTELPMAEEQATYAVSSSQNRIYLSEKIEAGGVSYNTPRFLWFEGELDPVRFEKTFQTIVERHESLRTSFEMSPTGPVQRIHEHVPFTVEYSEGDAAEIDAYIRHFIRPFDLSQVPLLRVQLVKVAEAQHFMLFDMHHIITDGVSMDNLIREMVTLYAGRELPALSRQYKDFSTWQNRMLQTEEFQAQASYWKAALAGELPQLKLPTDFPRPAVKNSIGAQHRFELDAELTRELRRASAATGTTLFMILLAAYTVLLAKLSGQEEVLVGSPILGRSHPDLDPMIGVFINTLVHRNRPEKAKSFADFLQEVKATALAAYQHQDVPFETLVETLGSARDRNRNPLFDVAFILQNTGGSKKIELENIRVLPNEVDSGVSKFDLTLEMAEEDDRLKAFFEYSTSLFQQDTIQRIQDDFLDLLRAILPDLDVRIGDLELTSTKRVEVQLGEELEVDFNF